MKINKIILSVVLFLTSIMSSFAVEVVNKGSDSAKEQSSSALKGAVIFMLTIGSMVVIGGIVLVVFAMVLIKIYKKYIEHNRKKKDFLYYNFLDNLSLCQKNKSNKLKFKQKRTLFLFWKRKPILLNTSKGYESIGLYDGETWKKEGFYFLAIYNKLSIFKYVNSIIMIPSDIYNDAIKRITIEKDSSIIINAEGIDTVAETDYYYIPLIPDKESSKDFLDFSDYIHTNFIEKVTYRDLVKENLLQYREGVIKSVEMNPNVHYKRRNE